MATQNNITISWDVPGEVKSVQLLEDGVPLMSGVQRGSYIDDSVNSSDEHHFELLVTRQLSEEQANSIAADQEISPGLAQQLYESVSLSAMPIAVPSAGFILEQAAAATAAPLSTSIRYATFIPTFSVEAPPLVCTPDASKNYRFLGDNRGYSSTSNAYRTRFDVTVDWLDGTTSYSRSVRSTTRQIQDPITKAWSFDEIDTANTSSMLYSSLSTQTSSFKKFRIKQNVGNPLCDGFVTRGISFDFDIAINRGGSYSVEGTALLAPNHELYIRDSDMTAWQKVFQRTTKSMQCLSVFEPFCTYSGTISGLR